MKVEKHCSWPSAAWDAPQAVDAAVSATTPQLRTLTGTNVPTTMILARKYQVL